MVAKVYDHRASDLPERVKLAMDLVVSWVEHAGRSVDDAFMERLREHYSDEEVVELAIAVGTFDFSHRFNAVMGVVPVHPGVYDTNPMGPPPFMDEHLRSLGLERVDMAGAN